MRVAVIGCGPSSLAAAWAAKGLGADVRIFGPLQKSPIRGAIVLHEPIPGITMTHPEGYVRQIVVGGDINDYGRKLYGDIHVNRNGDPFQEGFHTWRVGDTYSELWNKLFEDMKYAIVDNVMLERLEKEFDLVVNTAPATEFCVDEGHEFVSKNVELTWELMQPGQPDNTIYYNAEPDSWWARSSSIFGSIVTEWVEHRCPKPSHTISKPIRTDCNCHPNVFRTGRYGAWDNRSWIETAYYGTRKRIIDGIR